VTPAQAETAGEIQRAYPGWRVWVSDEGRWYATRVRPWARGQSATLAGPTSEALTNELAAEDTTVSAAHHAALTAPGGYGRSSPSPVSSSPPASP
jgi:hypothetical protein